MSLKHILFAAFSYVLSVISPVGKLLLGILFLVLADFTTGILAAKKKGEPITSRKMRPTVLKGSGYMIAILIGFIMERLFIPEMDVSKIIAGLIAFIELKSLDENLTVITGKSLFASFLKKDDQAQG